MKTQADLYLIEMASQGYSMENIGDFHRTMIPYLLKSHGIAKAETIAEIGTAQGHCLLSAYYAGYQNLMAIDCSDVNFSIFQEKFHIECHKVDVTKEFLPLADNSVGAFLLFHVIEHLQDAYLCLSEMLRVLKPGGWAFVVTPDWRQHYKTFFYDPTHVKPYDKEGLLRLMRIAGWKFLKARAWGSRYGLGRLKAYKFCPQLGMIGNVILVEAQKV